MVVVASLMVLTLVLAVLSVTVASRRITARYEYFFGMYDLAVAGNEQAFYMLNRAFLREREAAHLRAEIRYATSFFAENFFEIFLEEIMAELNAELAANFQTVLFEDFQYRREWAVGIFFEVADGTDIHDDFRAATTATNLADGFYIHTTIRKYADGTPGTGAVVRSRIKILDYSTLTMVELLRIAD